MNDRKKNNYYDLLIGGKFITNSFSSSFDNGIFSAFDSPSPKNIPFPLDSPTGIIERVIRNEVPGIDGPALDGGPALDDPPSTPMNIIRL